MNLNITPIIELLQTVFLPGKMFAGYMYT